MAARGLPVSVTFKAPGSSSIMDTAFISRDVWDQLAPNASEQHRIPVSVAPARRRTTWSRHTSVQSSPLTSLTCWAILDEKSSGLTVPLEWTRLYDHVFSPVYGAGSVQENTHTVSSPRLLPLQDVFIQALSTESYRIATAHLSSLEDWFCLDQRILRQGSSYRPDPLSTSLKEETDGAGPSSLEYRLIMTEPVLQGYARKGQTSFILLPPDNDTPMENGRLGATSSSLKDGVDWDYDNSDDVEIDEGFLANSLGRHISTNHVVVNGHSGKTNGIVSMGHVDLPSYQEFVAESLSGEIQPDLDDHTVYIRTADLSKVGVLDGDWTVVWMSTSANCRMVRIEANDDVVQSSGSLRASPVLLHNIGADFSASPTRISLQAAPEGLRGRALPTAKTVTIARVASKLSTNRVYQPLVLHALKGFFNGTKRLIRQGDLLTVKVDVDQLRYMRSENTESDGLDFSSELTPYPARAEQIIYFIVTNIDCDPSAAARNVSTSDLTVGLAVGELGCWVDSTVTRVIQAGIEYTRIPNGASFMGVDDTPISRRVEESNVEQNNYRAFQQIYGLASAALMPQALSYDIPISILLKGARGIGKFTTAVEVAKRLGMHIFEVNCYDFLGENETKTEGLLRARFDQATSCAPCIFVMRHIDAFTQTTQGSEPGNEPAIIKVLQDLLKDLYGSWRLRGYPILVFGTSSEPSRVPPGLLSCFKHEASFEAPGEPERSAVLSSLLSPKHLAPDVDVVDLARRTAAFVAGDLHDLVTRSSFTALSRVMLTIGDEYTPSDLFHAGIAITKTDFDFALDEARSSYSQNVGAPSIPNVSWDDVGGLADVKADILDTVQLPLEHPELFAQDLKKRSGILLYGPPGTGKTLLAKAVATSCSLNFFSVKGPELLNMYIGESEANVRRVFQRARDARPCVIFFDELDSVAPKRGSHGDSGGVMDRIVSQLLAELDGISAGEGGDVFVIGATNRPDLLDQALLRPGRFDRMLYLGVSDNDLAQLKILQALTRRFRLDPALELLTIAQKCPFNFTGADFYALCSDALLKAMTRKAEEIDAKLSILNKGPALDGHPHPLNPQYFLSEMAQQSDIEVIVTQPDFEAALRELTPSVSQAEMEHYAKVQQRFSRKDADPDPKGKGKGKQMATSITA